MNPDENKPQPPYRLSSSAEVNQQVRELAEVAQAMGERRDFLKALRQITTRLRHAPFQFGECRFRLPGGKLAIHIGAIQPAAVQFAIHEESPNVILLKVLLLGSQSEEP